MGLYFRKSINFGLFRLNFSKSGVSISFGPKGCRLSVGQRGTMIHAGRKGIYYKKTLSSFGKINSK